MPGIAGIITRIPADQARAQLNQMLGAMRHEAFYVTRTFIDEPLGLYAGWTALEGSSSDKNAAATESGNVTTILCGDGYSAGGGAFPANLNGVFHGLVADRRRHRVQLFNDRYGMHRVYWHQANDAVYFAAEANAILAACPQLRRLDARGLGETITLGCVLENRTLFEGLSVIPSGSLWTFEDARLTGRDSYFHPRDWEDQPVVNADTAYRDLRDSFRSSLPHYFSGPERIGMSLTGGLDTRMIMAWQTCAPGALPCYTFGGDLRDSQDVIIAREVARACGQPFTPIPIGDNFLTRFAHYAERAVVLSDAAADARFASDVFMNERARAIAPVRMTGLYGGEVLRRVRAFKPAELYRNLFQPVSSEIAAARATYARVLDGHPLSFAVLRQAPWYHQNSLGLERTQVTMRTPFLDNEIVKTLFRAPGSMMASADASKRLIADGNRTLAGIPTDRGWPFREFTFKAEYAFNQGMPQWLARVDHALRPLRLERLFRGRHKPTNFRIWYRGPLAAYVREVLLDPGSLARPYLDRKSVEHIVRTHTSGQRNYTTEIHKLLGLELVLRGLRASA